MVSMMDVTYRKHIHVDNIPFKIIKTSTIEMAIAELLFQKIASQVTDLVCCYTLLSRFKCKILLHLQLSITSHISN